MHLANTYSSGAALVASLMSSIWSWWVTYSLIKQGTHMCFAGDDVITKGCETMTKSNHEEADTRMVVHMVDALKKGSTNIMIRTVDTDVIIILIGQFHDILKEYPDVQIWVVFGTGKNIRNYHINTLCHHLGLDLTNQEHCHPFTPSQDVTPRRPSLERGRLELGIRGQVTQN